MKFRLALAIAAFPLCVQAGTLSSSLPSPYAVPEHQWATPPAGEEKWGSTAGIERGPHGEIWAIDRCGANSCDGSDHAPIVQLDMATGKPVRSIGAGLFVFPHGLHVDRQGNVWVTDGAVSKDGTKGLQVIKLSPDGKVLMRLGTAGQRGDDATHFQSPSDVITAPNGDIFVTDGHAPIAPIIPAGLDMRVMKFAGDGKFIKQWGRAGTGKGEFNNPHALAFDARGRLLVADRANNRIQIFDQDGKFLDEWKQFGRPSGFYVAGDRLYAIDADSTEAIHPGWKKGVWIGSISKALPDAFVPDDAAGEGVVVGPNGNMYGAVNVAPRGITRYLKQQVTRQSSPREKRS
ncbi:MAG TPA: peptidyl-alpha-hydroxyglycine alpha-amidating lyase family protein [Rhizomicrobium sp.]|nr:peptidyl-alpha-hydroxyglycine alpha-amidating lyase family protein [Rhizomicrobium sp.]